MNPMVEDYSPKFINKKSKMKYIAVLILGIIFSCSKSDETKTILAPKADYIKDVYQVAFHSQGNSTAPNIDWNGDVGLFSIQNAIPGVSIDFKTGVVSWNGTLPMGENDITILVVNEAGASPTNIQLTHLLSGNFRGEVKFPDYDPVIDFGLNFNANGSGTVTIGGFDNDSDLGFWTIDGSIIQGQYAWSDDPGPYFIEG